MQTLRTQSDTTSGPNITWLCAGFLLAGMGTVLLGPILPALAARWHLQDVDSGLLLFAKFTGAFVGGISVPNRLRRGVLCGLLATATGLTAFAFAPGPYPAAAALFIVGIGLGLVIASTNILAGRRYAAHTGSALALINFFWSLGAVLIGILIAALLPHHTLPQLLLTFAATFIAIALAGALSNPLQSKQAASNSLNPSSPNIAAPQDRYPEASASGFITPQEIRGFSPGEPTTPLPPQSLLLFATMLFLYGGLETSITQWLTTYTLRYTTGALFGGQSAIVVLFTALTAGRALTAIILRRLSESVLQRAALACSVCLIPILANCSTARSLSIACILLGLSLAPFFPATFAILMRRRPTARQAGFILAVSGLGAASITYLTGTVSTHFSSLRLAMAVPFATALALLAVSLRTRRSESGH